MAILQDPERSPGQVFDKESKTELGVDLSPAITSSDEGITVQLAERAGTKRNISSRQAQMISLGGAIGTSLFVGSGQALAVGGPAFLLVGYSILSLLVYSIVTGVIEVATYLPIAGSSMSYFCSRYASPSLGFALGWLYFYSFGIIVAYEITAASIIIDYWPNNVPIAAWITIMLIIIVALNLFPVGVYAESEFWFASLKVVMILGLLLLSLIIMLGGGPDHDRLGFRYWNHPGAVKEYLVGGDGGRFTALLYVCIFSGFSFYFTPEMIIFTVGEMRHPRKNLPIASRRFFIRLVVFYFLSTIAIGATCSSNAEGLTNGAGNANASPWVIAIQNASIPVLPSIINAGILLSAWSAGNSYLYLSSRALFSLALAGNAPKIFTRCTRQGLPIYCVLAASCFTLLAYLNCSSSAGTVFNWLISLTNTAGYTSWVVCSVIYLCFRKACDVQQIRPPYRSFLQPYASYVCIVVFTIFLLCNGFTVFYSGHFTVSGFLTTYLGIPVFLILWLGHKLFYARQQPWLIPSDNVDLSTDLREVEADDEMWRNMEISRKVGKQGEKIRGLKRLTLIWQ